MSFQFEEKKLYLRVNISERVPLKIISDVKRFKQVFFNLIGNAYKFTPKGGVTISADFDDGLLSVSVLDTGLGIA